jgi:hypothetical protein
VSLVEKSAENCKRADAYCNASKISPLVLAPIPGRHGDNRRADNGSVPYWIATLFDSLDLWTGKALTLTRMQDRNAIVVKVRDCSLH